MLDATSKLQSGILSGNTADFGAFDQCIAVQSSVNHDINEIKGKYCLGRLKLSSNQLESNTTKEQVFSIIHLYILMMDWQINT